MRLPAALALLAAAQAGCGGVVLAHESVERAFARELARRGHPDVRVRCPDVPNEVGRRFTCRVRGGGLARVRGEVRGGDRVAIRGVS